jgi:hypothetical protein
MMMTCGRIQIGIWNVRMMHEDGTWNETVESRNEEKALDLN